MTPKAKQGWRKVVWAVIPTLIVAACIWFFNWAYSEQKAYSQVRQLPVKVETIDVKVNRNVLKTDSLCNKLQEHTIIQNVVVEQIKKDITEIKEGVQMLIDLQLKKK